MKLFYHRTASLNTPGCREELSKKNDSWRILVGTRYYTLVSAQLINHLFPHQRSSMPVGASEEQYSSRESV